MKIAIKCDSPLMQRTLELFLAEHIVTQAQCAMVIRDTRGTNETTLPVFWITSDEESDLRKPFSKDQLFTALHKKLTLSQNDPLTQLHARLMALTTEYQTNLLKTLQDFHEHH